VWLSIAEFDRALGDGFSIHEPELRLRGGRPLRIDIDRNIVPILIDEYQRVLLHGHYADALMLPHNLLESAGFPAPREISQPELLQNLEILALNAYRLHPDEDWYAVASRALALLGVNMVGIAICALIAFASWHLFEKRWLALKRRPQLNHPGIIKEAVPT
jgi:hypothetical protein